MTQSLYLLMNKEIPVLTAEIRALYQKLDKQFKLRGAQVRIEFDYKKDSLGGYTPAVREEDEFFRFSLLFIARCVEKPMSKEDRNDLFLHEYAHYMQYNMDIPKEYTFSPGIHGSVWKYCCSLIGAAPTPYYKVGEGLMEHDYDSLLRKKSLKDPSITIRDNYRREQAYKASKSQMPYYKIGQNIKHPKYGEGTISEIKQEGNAIRLLIDFKEGQKLIDQAWLIKNGK